MLLVIAITEATTRDESAEPFVERTRTRQRHFALIESH